ncbi:MAG: glycosyltransferase [Rivularia sp. (in: cyanobacteria)]
MKVAFIVNNFPVVSQTFILNQITGLIDNGVEVDIYANPSSQESQVHLDVIKYNLLNKTNYFNVPRNNVIQRINSIALALANSYKHPILMKCLLDGFESANEAGLPRTLLPYVALPFLEKQQYDIIHCHFGPNGLKGTLLKKLGLFKGKLVTAFHGYDITKYIQPSNSDNPYKKLFDSGDLFLPISERWKHRLIELGCEKKKISVHRMGVDCTKFSFTPRYLSDDGQIRIVTIARFVEKKGVEYGIRAVAELLKKNHNIEYNIIGDGLLKNNLEQLIKDNGIESQVKLLGWKQQHEIVEILNKSHILLAPSVTSKDGDQEGIPVVLMEAMAMGLPVVSTQHSGIPELIEDGVSGFLVPERDVDALAHKLSYLTQNPKLWLEMGKAGRRYIEQNYNIEKLNYQLIDLYQELLIQK